MKKQQRQFTQRVRLFSKYLSLSLSEGEIIQSAIVIAYYLLFSIFPIIIIVGNVLPLFQIDTRPIAIYLRYVFPSQVTGFILPIITSLLKSTSTGYMSFGIIFAIWSFSCLVNAIRIGMNRLYGVHEIELRLTIWNFLLIRSLTVLLTALMIIIFAVSGLALAFGEQVLEALSPVFDLPFTLIRRVLSYRYPIVIVMMLLAVFYLNFVLPNIRLKRRIIWPGVLTTVCGWSALSYLFGFYLHHFRISWENYGIVGTFIIFMLWLNLFSLLLLFGTAVNVAVVRVRFGRVRYSRGRLISLLEQRQRRKKG